MQYWTNAKKEILNHKSYSLWPLKMLHWHKAVMLVYHKKLV